MDKTKPPRLPLAPELPEGLEACEDMQAMAEDAAKEQRDVTGYRFVESAMGDVAGVCLEFSGCVMDRCSFTENDVKRLCFVDVLFDHCDLSNMRFERATFQRARFQNCRMTGVSFGNAVLMNVDFQSCHMDYASFSDTKLDRVRIVECRLKESQWLSVALSHFTLEKVDLTGAQWNRTPLKGVDVRTSEIDNWSIDLGDLRGMRVTSMQALELSRLFGIVTEDF